MKIVQAQFMEPIESPITGNGGGMMDKYRAKDGAPLTCRAMGPGLIVEQADREKPRATVVPWGNVRFAVVEMEEGDTKQAAKR